MALSIPLTTTTNLFTDPGAAVFDFGGTAYSSGYLYIQNASCYVSLKTGSSQGAANWQAELPYSPTLIPLGGGEPTLWRRNTGPDLIYGVRARSLVPGVPGVIYGGMFQPGEATSLPSNQLSGTITSGGGVVPPVSGINGLTGYVSAAGTILSGSGFTVAFSPPGVYTITYTTAFTALPIVVATVALGGGVGIEVKNPTSGGCEIDTFQTNTTNAQNSAFYFFAVAAQ